MMSARYKTSPIRRRRRRRRSPEQMAELLSDVNAIVGAEEGPITIRHLFYRLVGLGVIEKTEKAYKSLCSHLSRWRKREEVPWDAFSDSTRWHISPPMFDGIADALRRTRQTYRRDLWATQPYYTEIWVEKDAVAGIISDVTSEFGVPLFVCRGFASLSSLYSASLTFKKVQRRGKAVAIYHLGDYDPSGHAAADAIERTFEEQFDIGLNFERIAILPEHIEEFNLPTRPTKESDSRSRKWSGTECVELDSMPPAELRRLVEDAITSRIDRHAWNQLKKIEREEQETLERTFAKIAA
jgi:predicted acyl esterase